MSFNKMLPVEFQGFELDPMGLKEYAAEMAASRVDSQIEEVNEEIKTLQVLKQRLYARKQRRAKRDAWGFMPRDVLKEIWAIDARFSAEISALKDDLEFLYQEQDRCLEEDPFLWQEVHYQAAKAAEDDYLGIFGCLGIHHQALPVRQGLKRLPKAVGYTVC